MHTDTEKQNVFVKQHTDTFSYIDVCFISGKE